MTLIGALVLLGAPAMPAPLAPARTVSSAMSVGATVVREEPVAAPAIAIGGGAVFVGRAGPAAVSAEGGTARRTAAGTIVVAGDPAATITITLTY